MQISSIQPIDRALSGATIPGQSGPGSGGNDGVRSIHQNFSITRTSPSDCLVSYLVHLLCLHISIYINIKDNLLLAFHLFR